MLNYAIIYYCSRSTLSIGIAYTQQFGMNNNSTEEKTTFHHMQYEWIWMCVLSKINLRPVKFQKFSPIASEISTW